MKNSKSSWQGLGRRIVSFALSAAFMIGMLPAVSPQAEAASWVEPYLDKVQEWGVMRGDIAGNLDPNRNITRAEFVTMVNRAYGYTEVGRIPFQDTTPSDWYYEDLAIAYNVGYFAGTSATTASPKANLTREQAAALLGRNMMLQEGTGETLTFKDSREISSWSRQMVEAATQEGFISGYPDGSFRAKNYVTRGEVASMLVRAVGEPIQDSGEQYLGTVNSNLTITAPGVTLRDTTVNGNLYVSGGVGLSNVILENVDVRGKIVVAGAGESEEGEHSVVLRNVEADELVLDSLSNQFVTLRTEGVTDIENVYARTQVYLEDMTDDGLGMKNILLEADANTPFQLAGNIKNVRNETSGSVLTIAQGVTDTITVDEAALGTVIDIKNKAVVNTINLDAGTTIIGSGDISHLNVNAPGSVVEMLPDTITVRPGITAEIYGQEMDSVAAVESSENPRLLAGYPKDQNVAPTTAEILFKTNKPGTIYWGLTALADGSLEEEELIKPPAYSGKIIKSGTVEVDASNTDFLTKLSGLTSDGSYYVSAVLVDNRGMRSPVKVVAFTTPDDTVPNFVSGYPVMSLVTNEDAQVTVMANKTCQLYWAVFPKGSTAPKAADFKAGSLEGNLGSGNMQVTKNSTMPFYVNSPSGNLVEQESYDLYLWLTDFDGAKSSAVKKLNFTTVDKTPPIVTSIYQSNAAAKTITITFAINEPATLYWGVVLEGDTFLRPTSGNPDEEPDPASKEAKVQVEAGTYAVKKGNKSVSKEGVETTFTISGLNEQTAYDLYYVAKDKAGNYSDKVQILSGIKTQDTKPPTVEQAFSAVTTNGNPLPETDIELNFSEIVWGSYRVSNVQKYHDFYAMYADIQAAKTPEDVASAKKALGDALRDYIEFWSIDADNNRTKVADRALVDAGDPWVIDYREAVLSKEEGKLKITFPTGDGNAALNLASGGTYFFKLKSITDTSGNAMPETVLDDFTTVFATVTLGGIGNTVKIEAEDMDDTYSDSPYLEDDGSVRIDMSFTMKPESTQRVPDGIKWDMLLWTDTTMDFVVYCREKTVNSNNDIEWGKWKQISGLLKANVDGSPDGRLSASLFQLMLEEEFTDLNDLTMEREFGIHVDTIRGDDKFEAWNTNVTIGVNVIAGSRYQVSLAGDNNLKFTLDYENSLDKGSVSIGVTDPFEVVVPFTDSEAPVFSTGYPEFSVGDISATMYVSLDRPGTVYYMAVPLSKTDGSAGPVSDTDYNSPVPPIIKTTNAKPAIEQVPTSGEDKGDVDKPKVNPLYLSSPMYTQVTKGSSSTGTGVVSGNTRTEATNLDANYAYDFKINDLKPSTTYLVYLVTQGVSAVYSETMCYTFTTLEAELPEINIDRTDSATALVEVDKSSYLDYALMPSSYLTSNDSAFSTKFTEADSTATEAWTEFLTTDKGNTYAGVTTVLDAMLTGYYDGSDYQGSIFDHYATENAKNTYAALIRQAATQGVVDVPMTGKDVLVEVTGSAAVANTSVTMTGMTGQNYYTLLVVGHTVNSSGDAFRASQQYYNVDRTPLTVGCRLSGQENADGSYTGTLLVTFSDSLYYRVQSTSTGKTAFYPVDYCHLVGTDTKHDNDVNGISDDGYKSLTNLVNMLPAGTGASIKLSSAPALTSQRHEKPVGNQLTFALTNVKTSSLITIGQDICGSNQVVREKQDITIEIVKDADGKWIAEITPETWLTAE